jgi:ribose transport system permease protein
MDQTNALNKNTSRVRAFLSNKTVSAFLIAIGLYLVGGIISPGFLHFSHLTNVLSLSAYLGIIALGQTLVIISGKEGIDLSVGSIISLSVCMGAQIMMGENQNIPLAAITVLAVGFGLGCVSGIGVSFFQMPPLVMTMAMGSVIQGLTLIYTEGQPKGRTAELLQAIGTGRTLDIPHILIAWIVIAAIAIILLSKTKWARLLYGIGENDLTARLSGARTKVIRMIIYGLSGAISALAGLFLLGYTGTAYLDIGSKYVMPSVAAVVIGGVSMEGGKGKYAGVIAGAIVLTTLSSILVSLNTGEGGRQIVYGMVLLILLAMYSKRKKN